MHRDRKWSCPLQRTRHKASKHCVVNSWVSVILGKNLLQSALFSRIFCINLIVCSVKQWCAECFVFNSIVCSAVSIGGHIRGTGRSRSMAEFQLDHDYTGFDDHAIQLVELQTDQRQSVSLQRQRISDHVRMFEQSDPNDWSPEIGQFWCVWSPD